MTDDGRPTGFDTDLEQGPALSRRSTESERSTVGLENSSDGELYAAVPEGESDWRVLRWAEGTRKWVEAHPAEVVLAAKVAATLLTGGSKLVKAYASPAVGNAMAQSGSVLGMAGNLSNLYRFAKSARETGSKVDAAKAVSEAAGLVGGFVSNVVMPNTGLPEHAQVPGVTAGTSVQGASGLVTLGDTEAEKMKKAKASLGTQGYTQHPNRPIELRDLQPVDPADLAGRAATPPGWDPNASAALRSAVTSAATSPAESPTETAPLPFSPDAAASRPTGRSGPPSGERSSPDSDPSFSAPLTRTSSAAYKEMQSGLRPRRTYTTTDLPTVPAGQTLPTGSRSGGNGDSSGNPSRPTVQPRAYSAKDKPLRGRGRGGAK
ncbi:hypothetical protein [Streptomyces axinellae]|uniref:Uncharacterized protein n=1 Tax=Streptomyces axinellae TaxID=552788 RepID=A0ABN3Q094_9ACTN